MSHSGSRRSVVRSRSLPLFLCAILCIGNRSFAAEPVPTIKPPPSWQNFAILVWQHQTNAVKDRALYESLNLHGFHIDREDAKLQQFAAESNWPFYVDHAADR